MNISVTVSAFLIDRLASNDIRSDSLTTSKLLMYSITHVEVVMILHTDRTSFNKHAYSLLIVLLNSIDDPLPEHLSECTDSPLRSSHSRRGFEQRSCKRTAAVEVVRVSRAICSRQTAQASGFSVLRH
jgi:hypothetical protein